MKEIDQNVSTVSVVKKGDASHDPRIGHYLRQGAANLKAARAALVGFPFDEGVRRNSGRTGAAGGPTQIRSFLYNLCPDVRFFELFTGLLQDTVDLGDILPGKSLEENQERLGRVVGALLDQQIIPVVLGGGHETSYGHFLGYVEAGMNLEVLNWDAHTDVREYSQGAHSGSPFRQMLEHPEGLCKRYRVAGAQPRSICREHTEYVAERGKVYFRGELDQGVLSQLYFTLDHPALVTFDLDAVDQAFAPGVSAPAADGLEPGLWLSAAYHAGKTDLVASFDIVELNPKFDRDGQTARLAALTVEQFLLGLAGRV